MPREKGVPFPDLLKIIPLEKYAPRSGTFVPATFSRAKSDSITALRADLTELVNLAAWAFSLGCLGCAIVNFFLSTFYFREFLVGILNVAVKQYFKFFRDLVRKYLCSCAMG